MTLTIDGQKQWEVPGALPSVRDPAADVACCTERQDGMHAPGWGRSERRPSARSFGCRVPEIEVMLNIPNEARTDYLCCRAGRIVFPKLR